jgi:hypothetical protein
MLGRLSWRGTTNGAVGPRVYPVEYAEPRDEGGVWRVIILARVVGALLASAVPMVQYSIPLTRHYITNLPATGEVQLGNGSGSQLLR